MCVCRHSVFPLIYRPFFHFSLQSPCIKFNRPRYNGILSSASATASPEIFAVEEWYLVAAER